MNKKIFTGERCILGHMPERIRIAQEHIARYNFALGILEQFGCETVLDAACGTGYGTWLMETNGFKTFGVDVDREAVEAALFINGQNDNRIHIGLGSLDDPKNIEFLKDEMFDAIVSFETIEHLEFPNNFLEWVRTKTDLLIFSLPISQPSEFHRQVYTLPQAYEQISKHFPNVKFLSQVYMNFYELADFNTPTSYLVGYAKV